MLLESILVSSAKGSCNLLAILIALLCSTCKEGNVFVDYNDVTFVKYGKDKEIDVKLMEILNSDE